MAEALEATAEMARVVRPMQQRGAAAVAGALEATAELAGLQTEAVAEAATMAETVATVLVAEVAAVGFLRMAGMVEPQNAWAAVALE